MINWVDHINGEVEGTPVNRKNLMAMQGIEKLSVNISKANGATTIISTNDKNEPTETVISKSGNATTIITKFTGANGMVARTVTTISKVDGVTTITKEVTS